MSLDEAKAQPSDEHEPTLREVSDARTLRALTHPVRVALIEVLTWAGPLTATEAGERIGESPTTCSFHLRQLAKYGFVEEAGGGRGRSRPWRITNLGMHFSSKPGDPEGELAVHALARMMRGRQLERYRAWLQTRGSYPRAWQDAAIDHQWVFWMTPDEVAQLEQRLIDLLLPLYRDRLSEPSARPSGALPVEMLVFGHPIAPPTAGG
jgi:predicted transcriptional regulator